MTRPSLETLQWTGLLAGPLAFACEHVVGVGVTLAACSPAGSRWSVPMHGVQIAVAVAAAVVVVLAEAAAVIAFRETRHVEIESEPPLGRIRFLSTAALAVGPLFFALVLLGGIGAAVHPACRQS
jgi:amino acid transporter